ncbi:MAG: Hsp20 family protein [Magnetospirillum sp.]|nr:Hsp20 family protein [Magnetospirillum sp.]
MRTFDLSPLFRSTVGFDHLSRMLDAAARVDEAALSYPPYNIEKLGEDTYRITMAVAGFGAEDIDLTSQDHTLVITGRARKDDGTPVQYLHRGIAGRPFERRFELADFIRVEGASLVDGLLHVDLVREVPEAMKPRTIAIQTKSQPRVIEGKAA